MSAFDKDDLEKLMQLHSHLRNNGCETQAAALMRLMQREHELREAWRLMALRLRDMSSHLNMSRAVFENSKPVELLETLWREEAEMSQQTRNGR